MAGARRKTSTKGYYAIQAEDEVTAIDLVLEGEGEEISSETRDAYISAYEHERSDPRPHA